MTDRRGIRTHAIAIGFGAILALGTTSTAVLAQAQVSATLAQKAPEASVLVADTERKGHVAVIVEFASPAAMNQVGRDSAATTSHKEQIAAMQAAIINTHFGSVASPTAGAGFARGLTLMSISPMFALNVTRAELEALANDPRVVRVHLNGLSRPMLTDSVPLIGMTGAGGAYAAGATGANQAVAVLDTGVQSNHEFLSGKVVAEACFSFANGGGGPNRVSLCPNGTPNQTGAGASNALTAQCVSGSTQLCEHGTHVAGIAGGFNTSQGAGEPPNGVGRDAKIAGVQVFTRFNSSADCGSPTPCVLSFNSDQILGLEHVFNNLQTLPGGVKTAAVNMSLGGGQFAGTCDSDARKPIIDALLGVGIATVIASGNSSFTNAVGAPGCISTAVTVGSTTKADVISSFSNSSVVVDLLAPGSSIQSSIPTVGQSTTTYAFFNGTSMATPTVAGAFAAIRTACPTKTVAEILSALQSTGLSVADTRSGGQHTKPRIRVGLAVQQLACTSTNSVATHDFNGDSRSDILWRNSSTGAVAMWLMNGGTVSSNTALGAIATNWAIVGQRDVGNNNLDDILWRDTSTGAVVVWLMNGSTIAQSLGVGTVPMNWAITAVADFNADGRGDILWRESSSGDLAMWLLNGSTVSQVSSMGVVATNWHIVSSAPGMVFWRDSSSNTVVLWKMNGASVSSSVNFGAVPSNWVIIGSSDFDGDGNRDVLWRDSSTGAMAIWFLNASSAVSSIASPGTVPTNWKIDVLGDYNGDGKADITWTDDNTGNRALWLMNGATVSQNVSLGAIATTWQIQGFNAN